MGITTYMPKLETHTGNTLVTGTLLHVSSPEDLALLSRGYLFVQTVDGTRAFSVPELDFTLADSATKPKVKQTVGVWAIRRDEMLLPPTLPPHVTTDPTSWRIEHLSFFEERLAPALVFRDATILPPDGVARY